MAGLPDELEQPVFEIESRGNDVVYRIGPDDHNAFISLSEKGNCQLVDGS